MALLAVWDNVGLWDVGAANSYGVSVANSYLTVDAEEIVTLQAVRQFAGSQIYWSQTAGEQVTINNSAVARANFVAPSNYYTDTVLVFRVVELFENMITVALVQVAVRKAVNTSKRITDILDSARITLNDVDKDRYSDEVLIRLLNEGQEDFSKKTRVLKGIQKIFPVGGRALTDLPSDCWEITRASYDGGKLPLATYSDIDNVIGSNTHIDNVYYNYGWEDQTGTIQALVYDKNNLEEIRLYPIPETTIQIEESEFGVLTEYTIDEADFNTQEGLVTSIEETSGAITVYYVRLPTEVSDIDSLLSIPKMYDIALKYYIIGHSFLNDNDLGWQDKGVQQLRFYEDEVRRALDSQSTNHTSSGEFATDYRSGF